MPPPTLLVPGNLRRPPGFDAQPPVEVLMDHLRARMPEYGGRAPRDACDRVVILKAKVSSGKSTTVPPELWRRFVAMDPQLRDPPRHLPRRPSVVCTQPRLLTAVEISKTVAGVFPFMELGANLGYITGGPQDPPSSATHGALIYCTLGTLLQQLRALGPAEVAERYRFICVDEIHERSLDADLALFLLRRLLRYMLEIRAASAPFLVLMSATIDADRYARYFGCGPESVFEVEGLSFPREHVWRPVAQRSYLEALPDVVKHLHESNFADPPGLADALVFLPGKAEMEDAAKLLEQLNRRFLSGYRPDEPTSKRNVPPFLVLKVESETVRMGLPDYARMLAPLGSLEVEHRDEGVRRQLRPLRRIILATSVAETGLTLDALKYVVDPGWARGAEYFPAERVGGLITRPVSRASAVQRAGRVGRRGPGVVVRLYDEPTFAALPESAAPAVHTEPVADFLLGLVCSGEFRAADLADLLLDPPPAQAVQGAASLLFDLGLAVPASLGGPEIRGRLRASERNPDLLPTAYGLLVNGLGRLAPEAACSVLAGYAWGACVADLVTMHAFLHTRGGPAAGVGGEARAAMLAEGLPRLGPALGLGPAPAPAQLDLAWMRFKFATLDPAIEFLPLFHAFAARLAADAEVRRAPSRDLRALFPGAHEWCDRVGLPFNYLRDVCVLREEVFGELVRAGLDPTYGQLPGTSKIGGERGGVAEARPLCECATFDELLRCVVRLKQCVYEGYKRRTGVLDPKSNRYVLQGVAVKTALLTEDEKRMLQRLDPAAVPPVPRTVILYEPALKLSRKTGAYEAKSRAVSALDGFVSVLG